MRLSPKASTLTDFGSCEEELEIWEARAKLKTVIRAEKLCKNFIFKNSPLTVLKNLDFSIQSGEWVSITGPSGSGKTTLLSLLVGLDLPSSGSLHLNEQRLETLSEDERADFRARNMGFVFQSFRLMPTLTALENVQVPLELLGQKDSETAARAMLERVGLSRRLSHYPAELSGGEQQRVAIARAFVARPKILFADEPTGNLDSKNGKQVLDLLREMQADFASTLVVVTHDPQVAALGQRELRLKDGELVT